MSLKYHRNVMGLLLTHSTVYCVITPKKLHSIMRASMLTKCINEEQHITEGEPTIAVYIHIPF